MTLPPCGLDKQSDLQPHCLFPLVSVPGLGPVPLQFSPQTDHLAPEGGPHKPLSRTRSEPLPQSPRSLHPHLLQQHHNCQLLERLKQQTHLGKVSDLHTLTNPSLLTYSLMLTHSVVMDYRFLYNPRRASSASSCLFWQKYIDRI